MKNVVNFLKNNKAWILFGICMIIVIFIAEDVFEKEVMTMDTIFYKFFVDYLRCKPVTIFMKIITEFGSALVLITLSILFLFFKETKRFFIGIASNLAIVSILNAILKQVVHRVRPEGYGLIIENGYSFPSGHSMTSMAFYGLIIYLIIKYVKNKTIKYITVIFLSILILLIGISRIYLGVHFASDVIGGFLFAIAYLIVFIKQLEKISSNK